MPIDWFRVAEPTEDGYGARVALHRAATRLSPARRDLYVPPQSRSAPLIFDHTVAVERCYPSKEIPGHFVDAPLDHPAISVAAELVRCWPSGFRRVQILMGSLHPLFDTRRNQKTGKMKGASASFSSEWRFATMAATVEYPLPLALACVRETAHQLLRAVGIGTRRSNALVLNLPRELCTGPGALEGQPVIQAVHRTFALAHEMELLTALLQRLPQEIREISPSLRRTVKRHASSLRQARSILERDLNLDPEGRSFFAGFFAWCSRLCQGSLDSASSADPLRSSDATTGFEGVKLEKA
jgi:hypothetical protein